MFECGLIPSFTLEPANLNNAGIAVYFLFSLSFLALLCAFSRNEGVEEKTYLTNFVGRVNLNCPRLVACVGLFLVISVFGSLYIAYLTIQGRSFFDYLMACVSNRIKASIESVNGPIHIFLVFPLANSVLVPLMGKDGKGFLALNVLCLLYLSAVFGSRILLLEGLIFSAIVYFGLSNIKFKMTINRSLQVLLAVVVALVVFTLLAGYRDYEFSGNQYTNSPIIWGISRMLDYPCSTLIYASHFMDLVSFPGNILGIFPTLQRFGALSEILPGISHGAFRSLYGQAYYTNLGAFTELSGSLGLWMVPFAVLVAYATARFYKLFFAHSLAGLMFYPPCSIPSVSTGELSIWDTRSCRPPLCFCLLFTYL